MPNTCGSRLRSHFRVVGLISLGALSFAPIARAQTDLGVEVPLEERPQLEAAVYDNPDDFAGFVVDSDLGTATVFTVKSRNAAKNKLLNLGKQPAAGRGDVVRLQTKEVERSWAQLDRMMQSVTADSAWIGQDGVQLTAWYIDPVQNCLAIGVSAVSRKLSAEAAKRFGKAVCLHERKDLPPQLWSRQDDNEPYAGGARIIVNGLCTAGFSIQRTDNAVPWKLLTAGHCGPVGTSVVTPTGSVVGDVTTVQYSMNGLDVALISHRDYYWQIYAGGVDSTTFWKQAGQWFTSVGDKVSISGATTGQHNSWTVTVRDGCFTFKGGMRTCHVDQLYSPTAPLAGGDSGAPAFVLVNSLARAAGLVLAGGGGQGFIQRISSALPVGWQIAFMP